MFHFEGFHGTLEQNIPGIMSEGIRSSDSAEDWLGRGSYYFIDGLSDPVGAAMDWASWLAYTTNNSNERVANVAAVKVQIDVAVERVLDLRSLDQMALYQMERRAWIEMMFDQSRGYSRPDKKSYDSMFIDYFKASMGYDVVIANVYMALKFKERYFRNESRIPNVTIACVSSLIHPKTSVAVVGVEIESSLFAIRECN